MVVVFIIGYPKQKQNGKTWKKRGRIPYKRIIVSLGLCISCRSLAGSSSLSSDVFDVLHYYGIIRKPGNLRYDLQIQRKNTIQVDVLNGFFLILQFVIIDRFVPRNDVSYCYKNTEMILYKKLNIQDDTQVMYCWSNQAPGPRINNNTNPSKIYWPYHSIRHMMSGKNIFINLYPSRGGIGIILNTASAIFIKQNCIQNVVTRSPHQRIMMSFAKNILWYAIKTNIPPIVRMIFIAGHASAICNSSLSGCLRYWGLYCTGLPRPNPTKNTSTKPIGSICANGLGVSLPWIFGVGSHNLFAIHAWAYSWREILIISIIAVKRRCTRSIIYSLIKY